MSDASVVTIAAYLVMLHVAMAGCLLLHFAGALAHIAHWLEGGE